MGEGKRKTAHHWAAKCKVDFAKDFEEKGIPLETTEEEQCQKELGELESFFSMTDAQVRKSVHDVLHLAAFAFTEAGQRMRHHQTAPADMVGPHSKLPERWYTTSNLGMEEQPKLADIGPFSKTAPLPSPHTPSSPSAPPRPLRTPRSGTGGAGGAGAGPVRAVASARSAAPTSAAASGRGWQRGATGAAVVSRGASPMPPPAAAEANATFPLQSSVGDTGSQTPRSTTNWLFQSADDALATISTLGTELVGKEKKEARQRIHRPITPRELADACSPVLISVPPIFHRTPNRPQESHYEYFTRKIPSESPEHRRVMWWRTETTRKVYNYPGVSPTNSEGRPKSQGSSWRRTSPEGHRTDSPARGTSPGHGATGKHRPLPHR